MSSPVPLGAFFNKPFKWEIISHHLPKVNGVAIHSAAVKPGDLFLAFKAVEASGKDGTFFISEAAARGAAAIFWEEGAKPPPFHISRLIPTFCIPHLRREAGGIVRSFYSRLPRDLLGVTGTNGKTSVVSFVRNILSNLGVPVAALGTLGVHLGKDITPGSENALTTSDVLTLYRTLGRLKEQDVDTVAMEVSSHGLSQWRVSDLRYQVGAFTSFSRDHFDYHGTEEDYYAAKESLFTDFMASDGTAVINRDMSIFPRLAKTIAKKKLRLLTYGEDPKADIHLVDSTPIENDQKIMLNYQGQTYSFILPLIGKIQALNVLGALGIVLAAKPQYTLADLITTLKDISPVPGRFEYITTHKGARIFVDYAHSPESIAVTLKLLRESTKGRLIAVFGAGGNRDTGKRRLMGEAASRYADEVIITDDNPRTEDPQAIRSEILEGCTPSAREVPFRTLAITEALRLSRPSDTIAVLGKGHETYQIVAGRYSPYDERKIIRQLSAKMSQEVLWSRKELHMLFPARQNVLKDVLAVRTDHRDILAGDMFICLQGPNFDGHDFMGEAYAKGSAGIIASYASADLPFKAPLFLMPRPLEGLEDLAMFSRDRSSARFIGVTGSSAKTSTKELLRWLLSFYGDTYATEGNQNNHIGLPLSLANIHRQRYDYCVLEMGMNHSGEINHLGSLLRPHIAVITNIGTAHIGNFFSQKGIARAKAEAFGHIVSGGYAVVPTDTPFFPFLKKQVLRQKNVNLITFGRSPEATLQILSAAYGNDGYLYVTFQDHHREQHTFALQDAGYHHVENLACALAVLLALELPFETIPHRLVLPPSAGRGDQVNLSVPHGAGRFCLVDQSYSANPQSMKVALHMLGLMQPNSGGRRLLVLGDMLELGWRSRKFHRALVGDILSSRADKIWLYGHQMNALAALLPAASVVGYFESLEGLAKSLQEVVQAHDIVMVKASLRMGLHDMVKAMKKDLVL